ncbi:MAG: hypothetical protein KDJ38_02370 [Gammaproteobacteria bacterium]|nr:hypothetical protein [Gammaproteobacteria bacterium]
MLETIGLIASILGIASFFGISVKTLLEIESDDFFGCITFLIQLSFVIFISYFIFYGDGLVILWEGKWFFGTLLIIIGIVRFTLDVEGWWDVLLITIIIFLCLLLLWIGGYILYSLFTEFILPIDIQPTIIFGKSLDFLREAKWYIGVFFILFVISRVTGRKFDDVIGYFFKSIPYILLAIAIVGFVYLIFKEFIFN